MADRNATRGASAPESPNRPTAALTPVGLALGKKEAQLQLADGTPLSGWLTSPEAFNAAVAEALKQHPRDAIRTRIEEAL